MSSEWTLTARWVLPVASPPLEGGLVTVAGERIAAVGPHGSRRADVDLGDAAVIPGLVNAHTHLDLTGLRGLAPPTPDFTAWLRQVIAHRRGRTAEQTQADVRAGIAECLRFGTTLVGDIAAGGASWEALAEAPLRAVVFYELLGLTEDRARQAAEAGRTWLEAHPATPTCRPGLSPHAPYSVCRDLFAAANELARRNDCPIMTHLAETRAERELIDRRQGPFVPFLQEVGAWDPDGFVERRTEALQICSQGGVRTLLAHCNYLSSSDLPRSDAVSIVYCPRTHAAFGHSPHPLRFFHARLRVALGTDSLASNPDLDLLGEARFFRSRNPRGSNVALLRMATLSGAEALGWAEETGSLTPGKSADLVVLPLPPADGNPHDLVITSDRPVQRVLFRGQWVSTGPDAESADLP
jgi:cytosine/adenosine deaminase-related metal-dependent hydrolase